MRAVFKVEYRRIKVSFLARPVEDKPKSAENQLDPPSPAGRRSRKIFTAGFSGPRQFYEKVSGTALP
jgi:hypothetical protein